MPAPAGLTCLKDVAAGRPNAFLSSRTSCQPFRASQRLINPGDPFTTAHKQLILDTINAAPFHVSTENCYVKINGQLKLNIKNILEKRCLGNCSHTIRPTEKTYGSKLISILFYFMGQYCTKARQSRGLIALPSDSYSYAARRLDTLEHNQPYFL